MIWRKVGIGVWCCLVSSVVVFAKQNASVVVSFSSDRIGEEVAIDPVMDAFLSPYRKEVVAFSSEVIGEAAEPLKVRVKPENGVSNFVADSLRIIGGELFETEIDVAFTNFGGLRRDLEKGPLSVGLMTELSPFENFVVLLKMKGDQLKRIVTHLARSGGWPQSGMEIRFDSEGNILSAKVMGEPIEDEKVYKIVTIDYLLNTDTSSYPREKLISVTMSGERQRDVMIEYLKRLSEKGIALQDKGDGRTKLTR